MSRIDIDEKLHEELVAYVDGELDDEAVARVEVMLEESEEARAVVEELRQLDVVIRGCAVDEPSIDLDFKVEAAARRAIGGRGRRSWTRLVASSSVVLAAAACALFVVSLFYAEGEERPIAADVADSTLRSGPSGGDVGVLDVETIPLSIKISADGRDDHSGRFGSAELEAGRHRVNLARNGLENDSGDTWTIGWSGPSSSPTGGELSMVIRTARMRIIVDELERSVQRVEEAVSRRRGHVERSSVEQQSALIVARVPSDDLDELRGFLRGLGEVIVDQTQAEDVAGEVMDIESRLRSARVTEERLLALAGDRTSNVEQILAVERELMRVREEIERLDGRQASLRDRVSLSTIVIELDARLPDPVRPSAGERLGDAAQDGVSNVGALLLGAGEIAAAYGLSFIVIAGIAYAVIRFGLGWIRRSRRRS